MDLGLSNKTAVVTGGGSGIGKAVCFLLAQEGARVAVVDLRADPAQVVAETIRKQKGKAMSLAADASAAADVNRVVARVSEEYGGIDRIPTTGHHNGPIEPIGRPDPVDRRLL